MVLGDARSGAPKEPPMPSPWLLSRRTFLRSTSACIALPWLDAMVPANPPKGRDRPPVRLGFFYVPNGVHMPNWKPTQVGASFDLPPILKPLEPVKQSVVVLSDLAAEYCRGEIGQHEPSGGSFLVGALCKHAEEAEAAGPSVDQVAAQRIGDQTAIDALTLAIDPGFRGDHGYSGTYLSHLSWRNPTTPAPLELNPKDLFDRLFRGKELRAPTWGKGAGAPRPSTGTTGRSDPVEASILDLVREDAKRLLGDLGANDRDKVQGYLDGIRSIERRLERVADDDADRAPVTTKAEGKPRPGRSEPPDLLIPKQAGIPKDYAEHVNLLLDILVMAFWTDTTRVASFMFSNEKSGRAYPEIGCPSAHHSYSHHADKQENLDAITRINTHHMSLFARMLTNMQRVKEGDGTLLDNVALCYGSGIGNGNKHNHDDLPILLAGGGGGAIKGGRHIAMGRKTSVCNLFVDMLAFAGQPVERFGDSTGHLTFT
jgi:hypothetical protein